MSKNLTYKLLSFAEREINVFAGDHAHRNLEASLKQARMLTNLYRSVFYLNTVHNPWSFASAMRKSFEEENVNMIRRFENVSILDGRVTPKFDELKEYILQSRASIVIINSWELTSSNYRLREELFFLLKKLVAECDLTVLVWTQRGAYCEAGEWKAGMGKIAAGAAHVEKMFEVLKEREPAPVAEHARNSNGAIRLFAEYQVIDDSGEVVPQTEEPRAEVKREASEAPSEAIAVSPVGALVRTGGIDPMTFDITRVCANVSGRDYKNLRGENWCPWENMSDDKAQALMPFVNDPFSEHFAPYYWGSALYRMHEEPEECPPLPDVWEEVYDKSVWFRDLIRTAGMSFDELAEANRKAGFAQGERRWKAQKERQLQEAETLE